jgi:uncharacterized membrane protein (DUF2068 family)
LVGLIGVFKLIKSAVLIGLGFVWLSGAVADRSLFEAAVSMGALDGHRVVRRAVARIAALNERELAALTLATFGYAALFAVEGVGLIRRRRWAEWMTVVLTASFIPFEVYELDRRPGAGKLVALVLNVAIVATLAWRLASERARRRGEGRAGGASRFRPA